VSQVRGDRIRSATDPSITSVRRPTDPSPAREAARAAVVLDPCSSVSTRGSRPRPPGPRGRTARGRAVWAGAPPDPSAISLASIPRPAGELAIVCPRDVAPDGTWSESGRRALRVAGTLGFAMVGVLAAIQSSVASRGCGRLGCSGRVSGRIRWVGTTERLQRPYVGGLHPPFDGQARLMEQLVHLHWLLVTLFRIRQSSHGAPRARRLLARRTP